MPQGARPDPQMAMTSWRLIRLIVVLIWNRMPAFRASSVARIAASKAPLAWRNRSWVSAEAPSRENDRALIPASLSCTIVCSSIRYPQLAMTMVRPASLPWRIRSRISGRSMGSPPVRIRVHGLVVGNRGEDLPALVRGQLPIPGRTGIGPAVPALEPASARDLKGDQHRLGCRFVIHSRWTL